MSCFVIWFTSAERFLGVSPLPRVPMIEAIGWHHIRWTRELIDAEKFGSPHSAELFIHGLGRDMRTMFDDGELEVRKVTSVLGDTMLPPPTAG